jgi:site-specific recombinase XerD
MLFDREDFERWLVDEGYQSTTIRGYSASAQRMLDAADNGELLPSNRNLHYAAKMVSRYVIDVGAPVTEEFSLVVATLMVDPLEGLGRVKKRRLKQKKRKKEAKSFSDDEWRALMKEIEEGVGPEVAVLFILATTALRIGDVLTLSRKALTQGLKRGYIAITQKGGDERLLAVEGAPDAWNYLAEVWQGQPGSNVLTLISPNASPDYYLGHPSYQKVNDELRLLAHMAGITSRVHLHRIRRTVAVQAFRLGGNMKEVQQMLDHKSLATTQTYLDEARPDDVAALQQRVRKHYT